MDAIALLLLFVLWVAISGVVVVKGTRRLVPAAAPWRVRAAVGGLLALIMFLIPAGDDLWGRYRIKQLCEAQGGVKIFKTVENVEGIQIDGSGDAMVRAKRYRFVESEKSSVFNGEYIESPARYFLGPTGRVVMEKNIVPKARYAYRTQNVELSSYIVQREQLIVDLHTGEILAKETRFDFPGGWVIRWLSAGYGGGPGAGCKFLRAMYPDFVLSVLKPIK